jgi:hypothetical protein
MTNSPLPTFLIIGAGKSGTTAVYEFLDMHPEVFMSKIKETNFFELEGKPVIIDPKDDPENLFHYPQSINNWEDYKNLFKDAGQKKARGEASPMYLYGKRAPMHIKEKLPDVKLIAILREPVDRLYSRWLHIIRDQNETIGDFKGCLDKTSIWWRRNDLIKEGFFGTNLKRYFDIFPKSQLKVLIYDDLKENPEAVMKEIYEFIGVHPSFKPDLGREYNVSGKPKNPIIDKLIGTNGIIIKAAKKIAPSLMEKLKNGKAKQFLTNLRKKNMERPDVGNDFKLKLFNEVYLKEVELLEKLIDRDLTSWKTRYETNEVKNS